MAVVTITGSSLAGGIPTGGAVGGASSLTTVGAIPYVVSSGVLGQDATALFWDATNDRLGIGTNAPTLPLDIVGSAPKIQLNRTSVSARLILENSGSAWFINSADNNALAFQTSNTERARFHPSSGNFMVGGTTDGGYKVGIQSSGSTGTLRVYDQGGAGSTLAVIQAGAAQSGNLQEWRENGGTARTIITSGGNAIRTGGFNAGFTGSGNGQYSALYYDSNVKIVANSFYTWTTSTTDVSGAADLGLGRSSGGLLEINNGTAGTYRDLLARRTQTGTVAVSALPAASAGLAGSVQAVSDALAPAWGVAVAGGGAAYALVTCNGAAWTVIGV